MKNLYESHQRHENLNSTVSEVISAAELSELLGIGKNRTYELLNNGIIKGFRIGSVWKISRIAVEAYIKEASGL